ncbi:AIPR family protein [Nitrosomonas sp. sh817]|uniref:AIPR family protein n=1 Tax=Nitrosomonas sp. sh817 TaxID=3070658 RepID=UPI0027DDFCC3|nr:AIPR family protein [Nitrosomonas sp. sh817]WMJ07621.1 AIPR family protein [Nitrosomonas sp. sh817]
MPTREEQEARVCTALEQRFFRHIPRVDRAGRENWTDLQHKKNRLSRSLAAFTIVGMACVADDIGAAAVVDAPDDFGIDSIFYDRGNGRLLIVQAKFKSGGSAPDQGETLKTINGLRKLINKDLSGFNSEFQDKFDEIEEALDTPGVTIHLVMCCLGEQLGTHATSDLNTLKAELNRLNDRMNWELCSLTKLCQFLDEEQAIASASVTIALINNSIVLSPRKAVYGQVKASDLAALVQEHGTKIFQRNIRHYLGSVAVNTSIQETVQRRPADFFYLNNGITALATRIVVSGNGSTFQLEGFSIVNGAQTAGSIAISNNVSPDALVMMTIIEIGQNSDDIGIRITKARNYQNVVRGIDFAGLDPQQERLRQELASIGIRYHYRPSAEAKGIKTDSIKVEEAALALACMSFPLYDSHHLARLQTQGQKKENGVDYISAAKKEIGRIWEAEGTFYSKLFTDTLSGIKLCRIVNTFRFLDLILAASEASERGHYERRMFFRHGRYFIVATIAHHCPELMRKAEPVLSTDDKTAFSRMANELSELIFIESRSLNAYKGYLSIFRNIGTCQELADGVVAKLPAKNILPSQAANLNKASNTSSPPTL